MKNKVSGGLQQGLVFQRYTDELNARNTHSGLNMAILRLTLVLFILFNSQIFTQSWEMGVKTAKKWISAACLASTLVAVPMASHAVDLSDQLQVLRQQQIGVQKERYEDAEARAVKQELLYPQGSLLARGACLLFGDDAGSSQRNREFPLGYEYASQVDPAFDGEDATLFLISVGRADGSPCAVTKMHLKDLQFPFVFEVTTKDLVFPYTPEAWTSGTQVSDSVVVTAIMSPSSHLVDKHINTRLGFAISQPVTIAGSLQRSTARVTINTKVNTKMYSAQEIDLLRSLDEQLVNKPFTMPVIAEKER